MSEFDYSKLRGRIREKYSTEANFASAMGMSKGTMSSKLNQVSEFTHGEIWKAAALLEIDKSDVTSYFFSLRV